jgi:hypothetical protein
VSDRFFTIASKLLESPLWLDEVFTRGQAWIDLIGIANFSPGFTRVRGIKVEIDRGTVAMSQTQLSSRWRWSRKKVDSFLKELEIEQQIEQQKNNVTTLIIIKNYDKYQLGAPLGAPQKHRRSTAEAPQSDFTFISRIKEEEREKDFKFKKKVPIPENFKLTEKMIDYAKRKGFSDFIDLDAFTQKFIIKNKAKGYQYQDWYSAWQDWLTREVEPRIEERKKISDRPRTKTLEELIS